LTSPLANKPLAWHCGFDVATRQGHTDRQFCTLLRDRVLMSIVTDFEIAQRLNVCARSQPSLGAHAHWCSCLRTTVSSGDERSPCVALRVRLVVCDGEGQGLVVRAAENCAVSEVSCTACMSQSCMQFHIAICTCIPFRDGWEFPYRAIACSGSALTARASAPAHVGHPRVLRVSPCYAQ